MARSQTIAPLYSRLVQVIVLGGVAGTLLGVAELIALWVLGGHPDLGGLVFRSLPASAILGLTSAAAWGILSEGLLGTRLPPDRRRLHWAVVGLALVLLFGVLHLRMNGPLAGRGPTNPDVLGAAAVAVVLGALVVIVAWRWARSGTERAALERTPRIALLFGLPLVAIALYPKLGGGSGSEGGEVQSNVLLVVMDTTRLDRLSAYGYPEPTSPVLAELAADGARFDRAYASAPWTVPSHASIFTAQYTTVHRATRERPFLDGELRTLAEAMGEKGLLTAAFARKSWLSAETGLMRGFDELWDLHNPPAQTVALGLMASLDRSASTPDKGAQVVNETALDWFARKGSSPFFAFVNYNEAHSDLRPPAKFRSRFLDESAGKIEWGRRRFPQNHRFNVGDVEYGPEDLEVFGKLYDAELAYQDQRLGDLIDGLEELGLLDETLVIVTADHGENLGDHGLLGHELSVHETLLHVPLVVRFPGVVPSGIVVEEPVENRLLWHLINAALRAGRDGKSLDPAALADSLQESSEDGAVISELYPPYFDSPKWDRSKDNSAFDHGKKALISKDWKFVWRSDDQHELYDLATDPGETRNLAASRPDVVERMLTRLLAEARLWQEFESGDAPEFSQEMMDRLKAMGY